MSTDEPPECLHGLTDEELQSLPVLTADDIDEALRRGQADRERETPGNQSSAALLVHVAAAKQAAQNAQSRKPLRPPDGWTTVDEDDAAHCLYGVRREDGDGCVWVAHGGRYLHTLHDADERGAFGAQSAPIAVVEHVLARVREQRSAFEHMQTTISPDPAQQELDTAQLCWTAFQQLAPAARVRVLDWLAAHITPEPETSAAPAESQNIVCEGEDAAQLDPLELGGHSPDTAHAVVRAAGLAAVGCTVLATAEFVAENSAMTGDGESTWCTVWMLQPASIEHSPTQGVLTVTVDSSDGYKITRAEFATRLV